MKNKKIKRKKILALEILILSGCIILLLMGILLGSFVKNYKEKQIENNKREIVELINKGLQKGSYNREDIYKWLEYTRFNDLMGRNQYDFNGNIEDFRNDLLDDINSWSLFTSYRDFDWSDKTLLIRALSRSLDEPGIYYHWEEINKAKDSVWMNSKKVSIRMVTIIVLIVYVIRPLVFAARRSIKTLGTDE